MPNNTGERFPARLSTHGVRVNKGQKETLLAAGGGHEAAAPTPKSSQCLMGPLPEWVAGMSPGMLSCVSPPRICSAPRKILCLYPSRGSCLLQTPETFLKENHPKVPHGSPQPSSAHQLQARQVLVSLELLPVCVQLKCLLKNFLACFWLFSKSES